MLIQSKTCLVGVKFTLALFQQSVRNFGPKFVRNEIERGPNIFASDVLSSLETLISLVSDSTL